ncbi:MAG TPA: hypothetical protein VF723_07315 [Pyrinomonadaceae bacterium]|jgi:hypothetical protein
MNGRNQIDYTDIGYRADTFKIDGVTLTYDRTKPNGIGKAAGTGNAVMLSDNDTVALTSDGAAVKGKVLKIEQDGFATVQVHEYITLPKGDSGTNSTTRGRKIVGAARTGARGYIRDVDTAVAAELGVAKGSVVNTADPDNVVVEL